jgi:16S rRNA (cytosine1402-N4)-methyltransferase
MTEITGTIHKTVLLNETIDGLNLAGKANPVVLDCTFGGGGHSELVLEKFPEAVVVALDQDKGAFERAKHKFSKAGSRITFVNMNFRDLDKALAQAGVEKIDGAIFDLGLSSDQLDNSLRGFSFMKDEPLHMTMKENPSREDLTASDIVNGWSEANLADIIYGYGEERYSRRIAKAIVDARQKSEIKTTFELVEIIKGSVPSLYRRGRLHFATRTFQAIRIAVNDELGALKEGLDKGFEALNQGGRMSVISFHSLEDRITKKFFISKKDGGQGVLINKKPILAGDEEIKGNPRSRSAKLRIIEKI